MFYINLKGSPQSYSKKKFASRLLERDKIDKIMENLLKNPNYDEETYEILKKRAQEMKEEDLQQQLEGNKDFVATQEDRGSKIFLTLTKLVIVVKKQLCQLATEYISCYSKTPYQQ